MRQLNSQVETWLNTFNQRVAQLKAEGFKATSTNAREGLANLTRSLITTPYPIAWVADDLILHHEFTVPIRIYHPSPQEALPILVYYHGGGHMAGSITVYDPICRRLANETQHIVISVDYRLAPECPYPAGLNDAYHVLQGLWPVLHARHIRFTPILNIAGDSGGGALVASISARAQFDDQLRINKQVLIYPSLDYTMSTPAITENGQGYLLESDKIAWYFDHYFSANEDRKLASPLFQTFTSKLPATLMISAEFCPLRDEAYLYAKNARQVGVAVKHVNFDHMIHTFLNMEDLVPTECSELYRSIRDFLK